MRELIGICVFVLVLNAKRVRTYSSVLHYVCACHCDYYVHREVHVGTSTFAMDPVCESVHDGLWGARATPPEI